MHLEPCMLLFISNVCLKYDHHHHHHHDDHHHVFICCRVVGTRDVVVTKCCGSLYEVVGINDFI